MITTATITHDADVQALRDIFPDALSVERLPDGRWKLLGDGYPLILPGDYEAACSKATDLFIQAGYDRLRREEKVAQSGAA